jgi:beta-lactamase regulating signal transducer with metallopeptidase domain
MEAVLRRLARPTRHVWLVVLGASLALPAWSWLATHSGRGRGAAAVLDAVAGESAAGGVAYILDPVFSATAQHAGAGLDPWLLGGWAALSFVLASLLAASSARLLRERRRWQATTLGGVPVRVSAGEVGPAVVGVWRPGIVLPRWALAAPEEALSVMVAHEAEHVRGGDTRLLFAGLCCLVLVPWNPALWWQFRRLRLAVELDCDARVLRRYPDARRYAEVLLEVGRRRGASALQAAAFLDGRTFLERRIRAMVTKREHSLWRAAALAALAGVALMAACEVEPPAAPAPVPADAARSEAMDPTRRAADAGTGVAQTVHVAPGRITGVVTDVTGQRIGGARITIRPRLSDPEAARRQYRGAITQVNGRYWLINVPAGAYTIEAQLEGHATVRRENLRVDADAVRQVDFELWPDGWRPAPGGN